jgi:hypothetical protein
MLGAVTPPTTITVLEQEDITADTGTHRCFPRRMGRRSSILRCFHRHLRPTATCRWTFCIPQRACLRATISSTHIFIPRCCYPNVTHPCFPATGQVTLRMASALVQVGSKALASWGFPALFVGPLDPCRSHFSHFIHSHSTHGSLVSRSAHSNPHRSFIETCFCAITITVTIPSSSVLFFLSFFVPSLVTHDFIFQPSNLSLHLYPSCLLLSLPRLCYSFSLFVCFLSHLYLIHIPMALDLVVSNSPSQLISISLLRHAFRLFGSFVRGSGAVVTVSSSIEYHGGGYHCFRREGLRDPSPIKIIINTVTFWNQKSFHKPTDVLLWFCFSALFAFFPFLRRTKQAVIRLQ